MNRTEVKDKICIKCHYDLSCKEWCAAAFYLFGELKVASAVSEMEG